MANTTYGDISPRTAGYAMKEMLKRGMPYLCLEKFGQTRPLPTRSTRTAIFRRYEKFPNTPNPLTEGVTPSARTLNTTDYPVTLGQYGDHVEITDVVMDTHEDPVLNEALDVLGEQAAEMIEMVRYNVVKAGTNVIYANDVAGRANVQTAITKSDIRKAVKLLKRQDAKKITRVVRSTHAYGTQNVQPAYVILTHTDMETVFRDMAGFKPVEDYGSLSPYEGEIGAIENTRIITSSIFVPWEDAGAAAGGNFESTSGTNCDVYPVLVLGQDAYGIVPLKGKTAITPMVVNPKPSDSDPLAQRGHVSWKAYQAAVILNDAWMVRLESACPL